MSRLVRLPAGAKGSRRERNRPIQGGEGKNVSFKDVRFNVKEEAKPGYGKNLKFDFTRSTGKKWGKFQAVSWTAPDDDQATAPSLIDTTATPPVNTNQAQRHKRAHDRGGTLGVVSTLDTKVPDEVREIFKKYDANKNGLLDFVEMSKLLRDLEVPGSVRQQLREQLALSVAQDEDGDDRSGSSATIKGASVKGLSKINLTLKEFARFYLANMELFGELLSYKQYTTFGTRKAGVDKFGRPNLSEVDDASVQTKPRKARLKGQEKVGLVL